VSGEQRGERLSGERVIVDDQNSRSHVPLIGCHTPAD
jgi:hypothetical protein